MKCKQCGGEFNEDDKSWCNKCRQLVKQKETFELRLRKIHLSKGKFYTMLQKYNYCCYCCKMPFKLPYEDAKHVIVNEKGLLCQPCAGVLSYYKTKADLELRLYYLQCVHNFIYK